MQLVLHPLNYDVGCIISKKDGRHCLGKLNLFAVI